jgi:hypothetical protein
MHIYRHTMAYASKLVEGQLFETEDLARDFDIDCAMRIIFGNSRQTISEREKDAIAYLAENIQYERACASAEREPVAQQIAAE